MASLTSERAPQFSFMWPLILQHASSGSFTQWSQSSKFSKRASPLHRGVFQTSTYIMVAKVSLSRVGHKFSADSRGWETDHILIGESTMSLYKAMNLGKGRIYGHFTIYHRDGIEKNRIPIPYIKGIRYLSGLYYNEPFYSEKCS